MQCHPWLRTWPGVLYVVTAVAPSGERYEVRAGVVCLHVKLCDPHLSALEMRFSRWDAIQIHVYLYLTFTAADLHLHTGTNSFQYLASKRLGPMSVYRKAEVFLFLERFEKNKLFKQEGWLSPTERASVSAISLRHIVWLPHESHAGMSLRVQAFGYVKRV